MELPKPLKTGSKILGIIAVLALLLLGLYATYQITTRDLSPESDNALYGAAPESGYPFVGYIIIEKVGGSASLCGANIISPNTAITAAHCTEGATKIYVNLGEYNFRYKALSFNVVNSAESPDYVVPQFESDAGIGDVAIIQFSDDAGLDTYASIAPPQLGCNYYIVGYGRNEDEDSFSRRGARFCIESIESERFEVAKGSAFFCNGDSGSGIYEYGTNNLVGLVSSFATGIGEGCDTATRFFATRIDANLAFVNGFEPNIAETVPVATPSVTVFPDGSSGTGSPQTSQTGANTEDSGAALLAIVSIGFLCCGLSLILLAFFLIILILRKK